MAIEFILDEIENIIAILNDELEIEYINNSYSKLLGYSNEFLIGRYKPEIIHPEDVLSYIDSITKIFDGSEKKVRLKTRIKRVDGSYIWILFDGKRIIDNNGNSKLLIIGKNIEIQKRIVDLEQKLIELTDRFQKKLIELNLFKDDFFIRIIQELRDLINGMKNSIQSLIKSKEIPSNIKEKLKSIYKNQLKIEDIIITNKNRII
ncbi:MAG: PAS domain S-box protein [Candidatus Helarchaeota archaeon]